MKHMIRSLEQERAAYQKTIECMRSCLPPDALTDVEMTQIKTGPNGKAKTAAKKPWWQPEARCSGLWHWSERLKTALVEGCCDPQPLLHRCTRAAEFCKCVMSRLETHKLYDKYLHGVCQYVIGVWRMVSAITPDRLFIKAAVPSHLFHCQFESEIRMLKFSLFRSLW